MRKPLALLLLPTLIAAGASSLGGQTASGAIQGRVGDKAGRPIVGAAVFLSSPAMQGQRLALTGAQGGFDFPSVPAGVYALSAEMPGFVTLIQEGIRLRTGESRFLRIDLTPSEEETSVRAEAPYSSLDPLSPKNAVVLDRALLGRLPLARDLGAVLDLAPGVIGPGFPFSREAAVLGGTVRDNVILLDGANLTDLFDQSPEAEVSFDILEEIEVVGAAQPASFLPASGGTIQAVTKSGGNSAAGGLSFQFMTGGLNKALWTSAEVDQLGTAPPGGDKGLIEPGLNLGGPLWPDRAWYFLAGRFQRKSQNGIFIGPYQDVEGRRHESYDWSRREFSGFFKLTLRPVSEARAAAWAYLADVYQPVAEPPSARLPFLSTTILDHEKFLALFATGDYQLKPNTLAFGRGAYISRTVPSRLQADAQNLSWTDDAGDLYGPIGGADYNSTSTRQRLQADGAVRHFVEGFLGTNHTLGAGVDFEDGTTSLSWWRADNFRRYFDSRNPGRAFYGDLGLVGFWLCGPSDGSTLVKARTQGLGAYVTDVFSVGRRVTVSLGLRFDWSWGWFPPGFKLDSGNALTRYIADAYLGPRLFAKWPDDFPKGFNPLDALNYNERKDLMSWKTFSPRLGLTFDVSGRGTTLFKASYGHYAEALSHRTILPLHPLHPRELSATWLDVNGDGRPDVEDEYGFFNLDYRELSGTDLRQRFADGLKAPRTEEFSAGLEQELFGDLTLGLRFISRTQKNILEDALTNPDTGEVWYEAGQPAAGKYWIPFTTTVPGTGSLPDATVTLFARSLQAPPAYLQLRNVPELERSSRSLEFVFRKRLSRGWQAAGSAVLSRTEGNIGAFSAATTGLTEAADSPNYFVNRTGRLDTDRPFQVDLMAGFELPLDILLSGTFTYQSGRPWQRWAYVLPPASWCAANGAERTYYAVNLESSGARREKAFSSLDIRLEKTFPVGLSGRLGFYLDIVNMLGYRNSIVGLNDVDRWMPSAEGAGKTGQKFASPDFGLSSALYGRRTLRLGLRLDF